MTLSRVHKAVGILIAVNAVMFVAVHIAVLFCDDVVSWLAVSADTRVTLSRPWTLLTYMFTQWDILHLLANILWLWLWSAVAGENNPAMKAKLLVTTYLAGGLMSGVAYLVAAVSGADCGTMITGASAAVVAVIVCGAINARDAEVNVVIFGRMKVRWVALVAVAMCVIAGVEGSLGATIAHTAGIVTGLVFGIILKYRYKHIAEKAKQTPLTLDDLLAKVSRSGYGSLTKAERARLFEISDSLSQDKAEQPRQ